MHPEGSIQPWLVSADEGSLSDAIKLQDPQGTRTMPKPELQLEYRGPAEIAAAALKIFGQGDQHTKPSQYLPEVLRRACRNFEKFHRLEFGSATEERVDASSLTVAGWADCNVDSFEDIEERKSRREANSLAAGCTSAVPQRGLFPLVELEKPGLSSVSPAEWVLIDVIADSGACETVMPKGLCANIALKESAASKAGVEYEVASGKAVPNLGERHCEIYCEGAASSMMMHF